MKKIELKGQTFQLLPERAMYWEEQNSLIVADLHLGKAASFRANGIVVPPGITADDFARLRRLIQETGSKKLFVLGDFFHASAGITDKITSQFNEWRESIKDVEIILLKGNHDSKVIKTSLQSKFDKIENELKVANIILKHSPEHDKDGYVLSGHIHPSVKVKGTGKSGKRLPCFYFRDDYAILPAFGTFTGTAKLTPKKGDRVFVIADEEVIEVG
jgi:DNA ligase-associated metallophosphoesterase